jgi:hypothetical protein
VIEVAMYRAIIRSLLSVALIGSVAASARAQDADKDKKNENLPLESGRTVAIDTDEGT